MELTKIELFELYEKYANFDFESVFGEISQNNLSIKYSRGGILFPAGVYAPSYVEEMMITNCNVGKEIENPSGGFDFKYYFDDKDRIVLSEKYLDGRLSYLNFYFYSGDACDFIFYNYKAKHICTIGKSFYDESGKIIRYIQLDGISRLDKDGYKTSKREEQLFRYEDDVVYITTKKYYPFHDNELERALYAQYNKPFTFDKPTICNMMVRENVLYYLSNNGKISSFWNIRFKLVDGKKVPVPLPKKVPVFKIIKERIIEILNAWKDKHPTVVWLNCQSADIEMQYTTVTDDSEDKWNIAFYDANEVEIFAEKKHAQVLEDLLFNEGCNVDDLINESDYFVNRMIKIIKEIRKEGHVSDNLAIIISDLEVSENTIKIAKKINKKEVIKGFIDEYRI